MIVPIGNRRFEVGRNVPNANNPKKKSAGCVRYWRIRTVPIPQTTSQAIQSPGAPVMRGI